MTTLDESAGSASPLNAALVEGLQTIAQDQVITFQQYTRVVLPLDGFIFWVNNGQTFNAQGSLHVDARLEQREDESIGIHRVVFTSESQVQDFATVEPGTLWVGTFGKLQFSFSSHKNFYKQASLWHYVGEALYPALGTQLVNSQSDLNPDAVIVSNSLPVWLLLGSAASSGFPAPAPTFPIYPSFAIPQDAAPPYAAVHIEPNDTKALQAAPWFDYENSHWQLCRDLVRITLYGVANNAALDFQDFIFQYSLNTDIIGVMNTPVWRDEKRTQREMQILAQKKSFEIEVSYYQQRIQSETPQLILTALATYLPNSL